ncbi:MAG: disulfide isomerase DsbC N-terminal domain-containing protein [Mariprofundaceae bacterium]|nr:disulfide isomerase DsbC N-terminal domain-containing protein [Mariprofundaceae bacterium]
MMRKYFIILLLVQCLLPVSSLSAQGVGSDKPSGRILLLESLGAGATLMHAAPARIAGFEELIVRDNQGLDHVFYLSADGNMAFSGALLDVQHKKNITQASYGKFVAAEIAKGINRQHKFFIPYRQDTQHEKKRPPLYLFLGPSCPDCLHLWDNTLLGLNEKYDIRLSYGGLSSLGVKQVRKAMWGWCLKGDKRRRVLSNNPLAMNVDKACTLGMIAFNRMKETFGRYIRRIPVAYNEQGEIVPLL